MTYVAVMIGSNGREYRTPCRSAEEAQRLADNYGGLGFMGWVEIETEG